MRWLITTNKIVCDRDKLSGKVYQFDGFSFYSSIEQPNSWSNHSHQEIQITLLQANAKALIHYSSANKSYSQPIAAGQSFLVALDLDHSLHWQQTAELTLFYLQPKFFTNTIGDVVEKRHLEIDHRFSLVNDTLIRQIGTILHDFCQTDLATENLYVENLASLLAVHLLKKYSNYHKKLSDSQKTLSTKKLNVVLEYIEANLDDRINLVDLAKITGVGKFHFCRLFKNSTNLSPYQYVLHRRIERAKKLLETSAQSIADISLESGFSSQSHLAKHFRDRVGVSPTRYRQSVN